jgi:protein SCO1
MSTDCLPSLRRVVLPALVLGWLTLVLVAQANVPDRVDSLPKRAERIDVTEHLGRKLPVELGFIDQHGKGVTLGESFVRGLPVVVTMNYSSCPMLCSLQLDGLVKAFKNSNQLMGRDYRVVTVSYDPMDTPDKLERMRVRYLRDYGRSVEQDAWTMLKGSDANVHAVAEALGIGYAYNEVRKEYLHPAVFAIVTPQAVIARYLYGLEPDAKTVAWSLIEASNGRMVNTVDRFILFCFHYDSAEGRYAPVAYNIMRVGAALTVILLGSMLAGYWLVEWRRRRPAAEVPPC